MPRRGGGWLPQRDETKSETAHPPVSSSRAQPSIFLAGGKTVHMRKSVIPSRMKYGVYRSSHTLRFNGVQGRFLDFARNDNTGKAILSFLIRESFHRKPWTTTPMVSYYFFSQYAISVSTAPMPRAVLMPMPVYMAKEARVAARLATMSFLKKP